MSHEMSYLGARGALFLHRPKRMKKLTEPRAASSHEQNQEVEAEYDRLRNLARQEASQRSACFDKVRPACCV